MHTNTKTLIRTATGLLGGLTIVAAVFLGSPGATRADATVNGLPAGKREHKPFYYQLWQANYGTVDSSSRNGGGTVDAADYVIWHRAGPAG